MEGNVAALRRVGARRDLLAVGQHFHARGVDASGGRGIPHGFGVAGAEIEVGLPGARLALSGAMDLRTMGATAKEPGGGASRGGMPADLYFGWLGIRLDSGRADGRSDRVLLKLEGEGEWLLDLGNSVLHASKVKGDAPKDAAVTLEGPLPLVQDVFEGVLPLDKAKEKGLAISDEAKLAGFVALFDKFSPTFNLVEP
jgi:alkyl sulfatase BDS1-like metallo-beta-lactamase superfamily hydrolase